MMVRGREWGWPLVSVLCWGSRLRRAWPPRPYTLLTNFNRNDTMIRREDTYKIVFLYKTCWRSALLQLEGNHSRRYTRSAFNVASFSAPQPLVPGLISLRLCGRHLCGVNSQVLFVPRPPEITRSASVSSTRQDGVVPAHSCTAQGINTGLL